jgi:hypothetical protein
VSQVKPGHLLVQSRELRGAHAAAPATRRRRHNRLGQSRVGQYRAHEQRPRRVQRGAVGEQLGDVRPDDLQPRLHPAVRLLGAAAQPQRPLHGMVAVVGDFLDRLAGHAGQQRVVGSGQLRVQLVLIRGEHQQPGGGDREVTDLTLHQMHAPVLLRRAPVRQRVLVEPVRLPRVGQQRAGLTEQVQRDVGQRDLLLQAGRAGDPLGQALRRDQCVVAQRESFLPGAHR